MTRTHGPVRSPSDSDLCLFVVHLCCCFRASPPALSPPPPSSPSRNPLAQKPFTTYPYFLPLPAPIAVQTPPRQCATVKGTMKLARYLRRSRISPSSRLHPRISRIPYPIIPYPQDTRTPLSRIAGATRNLVILYSHPAGRGAPLRWDA